MSGIPLNLQDLPVREKVIRIYDLGYNIYCDWCEKVVDCALVASYAAPLAVRHYEDFHQPKESNMKYQLVSTDGNFTSDAYDAELPNDEVDAQTAVVRSQVAAYIATQPDAEFIVTEAPADAPVAGAATTEAPEPVVEEPVVSPTVEEEQQEPEFVDTTYEEHTIVPESVTTLEGLQTDSFGNVLGHGDADGNFTPSTGPGELAGSASSSDDEEAEDVEPPTEPPVVVPEPTTEEEVEVLTSLVADPDEVSASPGDFVAVADEDETEGDVDPS